MSVLFKFGCVGMCHRSGKWERRRETSLLEVHAEETAKETKGTSVFLFVYVGRAV